MTDHITTDNLVLRRYKEGDARQVCELIGDIEVSRWLTRVPHPYSLSDAQGFIKATNAEDELVFAITLNNKVIGGVSIKGELGYWIGKPHWGNGYATAAARALVEHATTLGHRTLESGHLLNNTGSRKILLGLGFQDTETTDVPSAALKEPVKVQKMRLVIPVKGQTS